VGDGARGDGRDAAERERRRGRERERRGGDHHGAGGRLEEEHRRKGRTRQHSDPAELEAGGGRRRWAVVVERALGRRERHRSSNRAARNAVSPVTGGSGFCCLFWLLVLFPFFPLRAMDGQGKN
jgi:hypothetical protein